MACSLVSRDAEDNAETAATSATCSALLAPRFRACRRSRHPWRRPAAAAACARAAGVSTRPLCHPRSLRGCLRLYFYRAHPCGQRPATAGCRCVRRVRAHRALLLRLATAPGHLQPVLARCVASGGASWRGHCGCLAVHDPLRAPGILLGRIRRAQPKAACAPAGVAARVRQLERRHALAVAALDRAMVETSPRTRRTAGPARGRAGSAATDAARLRHCLTAAAAAI
eukprot:2617111-Prymnesium_polylepis.1